MRKKEVLLFFLMGIMVFPGYSQKLTQTSETTAAEENTTEEEKAKEIDTSNMFSDRDKEVGYDESESALIQLSDQGSSCDSDAVTISENTITIIEEGTYILSGELTEGMILVDAEDTDKIQLVLNQVTISNSQSAALYIRSADKVLAGTENTLENGGTYTAIDDNNIDAAVFAKSDITFNGEGTLTVFADAGHGIVSKDDLVITSGTYSITSAEHGISGKDSVRIANGSFQITAGKDGIHAENTEDTSLGFVYLADGTFKITSKQDGISAGTWLQAEGGTYEITTGDVSMTLTEQQDTVSMKGFKAGTQMMLMDGQYTVNVQDDALHSNGSLLVGGGTYHLSSGDDGIHGDSNVTISAGNIDIAKSYEGIEGLSIDITGGEISVKASDDGINAAGGNDSSGSESRGFGGDQFASTQGAYISIQGGTLCVNASGDGIDSNGDITVSGGETYLSGPTNDGNGTLDYSGTAVITGGIFAASGSSGMAQNFDSSSSQGAIMLDVGAQEAGTAISLTDSDGTEILTWNADKEYSSVLISCPEIKEGETYILKAGASEESITMDSLVYGNSSQMGGEPGRGGGKRDGVPNGEPGNRQEPGGRDNMQKPEL